MKQRVLNDDLWVDCNYLVTFIALVVEIIQYANRGSPSLGKIYGTFDSMLSQAGAAVGEMDPSLQFFTKHI